ncbi:phosphatase PAP2 family protein [Pseudodesulfovibrio piezophilus]|uniref:Phosphoesterase PA-phosphatase related protein n=1 Tax=Pseudodesulfovibrio piezophilus (strain DSM 21447 / JCM 15486 / C1TLV30) TaxID=1322246 RepID=M1WV04_PSEP2|nr:phosphatase PAP2 family protein [Pseudodesulfovibrio piezophilus]CCH48058.1 Phosphoesterase PA-phosphatase related protein [Pseudodesulfovibrio piezophilus C1TLV30]
MFFLTPSFDLHLFVLINQHLRCGLFDGIMPILSSMTVLIIILAIILAFLAVWGGKKNVLLFLILIAAVGVSDFSTNLVKKQVNRVRPYNSIAETHYREDGEWRQRAPEFSRTKITGRSYPSAHAANTMCLALLTIVFWPAVKKWPLLLPAAVGYSRIYLGKHYPTDILAGWLMGAIVAVSVWLIWRALSQRVRL